MPATSKAQQAAFGIARAIQKGERPAGSGPSADIAKSAKPEDVEDFASTPTKGLPQRVSKEDVDRIREYVTKVVREIVMKRRQANEDGQGLMKSEAGGRDDPAFRHQLRIARDTLKMSKVGANIMGGMTHDEARAILMKNMRRDGVNQISEAKWTPWKLEWYDKDEKGGTWHEKEFKTEREASREMDVIGDRLRAAGDKGPNISYGRERK